MDDTGMETERRVRERLERELGQDRERLAQARERERASISSLRPPPQPIPARPIQAPPEPGKERNWKPWVWWGLGLIGFFLLGVGGTKLYYNLYETSGASTDSSSSGVASDSSSSQDQVVSVVPHCDGLHITGFVGTQAVFSFGDWAGQGCGAENAAYQLVTVQTSSGAVYTTQAPPSPVVTVGEPWLR